MLTQSKIIDFLMDFFDAEHAFEDAHSPGIYWVIVNGHEHFAGDRHDIAELMEDYS